MREEWNSWTERLHYYCTVCTVLLRKNGAIHRDAVLLRLLAALVVHCVAETLVVAIVDQPVQILFVGT